MKTNLLASLVLAVAAISLPAQAQPAVPVKNFDIYVDLPTGFVFLKLPAGWKFVGSVAAQDMAALPPQVLTTLLPPEPAEPLPLRTAESNAPAAPAWLAQGDAGRGSNGAAGEAVRPQALQARP